MDDVDLHGDVIVRVVTIITLGVILLAAVVGLTVVAVLTDRDLLRAETFTFGGVVVLAALGGLSWAMFRRRRHWHVSVDRENGHGVE